MTILILTHIDKQTSEPLLPHLENLKLSNPDSDIHVIIGKDSEYGKNYNWKNSDQQLRDWWKANGNLIKDEEITIIEWDTLITTKIPTLPKNLDLASKTLLLENTSLRKMPPISKRMSNPSWTNDNWMWWKEVKLLELNENQQAIGLVSFGFYSIRKWVLDKIIDHKWDHIFAKSIQNELRFPTIAKLCGAQIGTIDLPFVEFYDIIPKAEPGIYHGVNHTIDYYKEKQGPGTELKKLLSYIGIKATPNCSCNHRANLMNYHGADWCEQNIDQIIEWLKEEAEKRKLLFIDRLARLLVKKAIKNSRKY